VLQAVLTKKIGIALARGRCFAGRLLTFGLAMLLFGLSPVQAQSRSVKIIRDAEIEALLRDYAAPLFKAAGIGSRGADIIIVQDRSFNAFVASGSRMFFHTGTLLQADTPNEVIGVIAHETGHLAGGHLQGLRNEMARAQAIGLLATLLGAGAMIAGSRSGSGIGGQVGAAATTLGPTIAMRTLLSYRRAQESAADRAALKYLNGTKQSASGMIRTFQRFADQALFAARFVDPYVISHPMPRERIAQLERAAGKSRYWGKTDAESLVVRHAMMQAKLAAHLESPARVARRFPKRDKSIAARYARAIVAYRTGSIRLAVRQIDDLIRTAPNYPYFHELKGQALLESGKAKASIAPLRKAVALAPNAGLIRILLGHAMLETGDRKLLNDAVGNLRKGLNSEPLAADGYRFLATALAQQGRVADAEVATARGLLIKGQIKSAKNYAKRAQAKLKRGTPGWLQADDILSYKVPKPRK